MTKKIAFFTPYFHSNRGNATTTKRIVHGLREAGIDVFVVPYLEERWSDEKEEQLKKCDLYHILHIYRFAKWNMCRELLLDKPYILTNGGTDINYDLANPAQVAEMNQMIQAASAITVFTEDGRSIVQSLFPDKIIKIIPQSVWFEDRNDADVLQLPKGNPIIFLPAGIRAIKDPLYVWKEIKELKKTFQNLQFIIAGIVIEKDLFHEIDKLCKQYDWVHFLEDVPFYQMKQLYEHADITINTSVTEGQSSSIIEAMYNGCPVLVRANEGNLSLVKHEETGFVFTDQQSFFMMATKLLTNKDLTDTISTNGEKYVLEHHSLQKEVGQYIQLYNQFL
ncbi:glycosyltransferase involved in cell wall biosynthesis [Bacillus mesophilus]|uniref:Glycosyltransferase family 4 protein n=1 Tax=Bacillus mesophilus TaxID=1808955 RepID=A0A6M0Q1J2_9BACI|nr:glycosyltransferase family 4 protein [Bacillus mesophilus]MBM7659242.1 glycosyltransferase involved in cell wall biosynthesis [Bacillus mesophilus]NEY70117.1 glycosyltransferase family 4 protein [Bacillus mesophilus]